MRCRIFFVASMSGGSHRKAWRERRPTARPLDNRADDLAVLDAEAGVLGKAGRRTQCTIGRCPTILRLRIVDSAPWCGASRPSGARRYHPLDIIRCLQERTIVSGGG